LPPVRWMTKSGRKVGATMAQEFQADQQKRHLRSVFFRLTEKAAPRRQGLGGLPSILGLGRRVACGKKLEIRESRGPGAGTCFYFSRPIVAIIPDEAAPALYLCQGTQGATEDSRVRNNSRTGQLIQSANNLFRLETLRCDKAGTRPWKNAADKQHLMPSTLDPHSIAAGPRGLEVSAAAEKWTTKRQ